MKKLIKIWLFNLLKDTYPKVPNVREEVNKQIIGITSQYSECKCVSCNKIIIAHYGGFYRNSKGEIFCSHKCIDK